MIFHGDERNSKPNQLKSMTNQQNGLTRRQFLTYVLGGTGAFMGALIIAPNLVSAFDSLHRSGGGSFSKTSWKISDFNEKLPAHVTFSQLIDDGWNTHNEPNDVFIIKYQGKLMIMSHTCTHLGCHVDGSLNKSGQSIAPEYQGGNWFHCPCHGSLYNIYGVPTPTSPAPRPLNLYEYKLNTDGTILVGQDFERPTPSEWQYNPNPVVY